MTQYTNILWAVGPAPENDEIQVHVLEVVKPLLQKLKAHVQPVSILRMPELNLNDKETIGWVQKFEQQVSERIASLTKTAQTELEWKESKLIIESSPTIRQAVRRLNEYGQEQSADLIVLGSHGRSGLPRLFLGSFAETMALYAKSPLLIVPPHAKPQAQFKKILFPTDFSDHSREALKGMVNLCKAIDAELTLFHQIPRPVEFYVQPLAYPAGGRWIPLESYFEEAYASRSKLGQEWVDSIKPEFSNINCHIDKAGNAIADTIIDYAHKNDFHMVCMATDSNALEAAFLGSITRQVLRHTDLPVWITHA